MLARLRDLTREVQEKARSAWGKSVEKAVADEGGPAPVTASDRPFCDPEDQRPCITVCHPVEGCQCGSEDLRKALEEAVAAKGLDVSVGRAKTACDGKCNLGPFIGFPQRGFFYVKVPAEAARLVVEETLCRGKLLFPYLSVNPNRSYRPDILYDRHTGMLATIDDGSCMVEVAKYFLDFEEDLSCGKCVPCRLGIKRMMECLERIVGGEGTKDDLEQIKVLCDTMIYTPHCEFAMTSTRPVLSAVTHFEDEFLAHIEKKECAAGVCRALVELQRKRAFRERMAPKKKKGKK